MGPGEEAREILEESFASISDALRTQPETTKISVHHIFLFEFILSFMDY